MLVEEHGVPLSFVVSGANVHDSRKLGDLLDARIVPAPDETEQNLCLDAGYVGKEDEVKARGYIPHIRPRGGEVDESRLNPDYKPRRWIVECAHSWVNRFRKLVPRYEKTDWAHYGLLTLACAMITLNKIKVIYG
jgi:IS5 family transposase